MIKKTSFEECFYLEYYFSYSEILDILVTKESELYKKLSLNNKNENVIVLLELLE